MFLSWNTVKLCISPRSMLRFGHQYQLQGLDEGVVGGGWGRKRNGRTERYMETHFHSPEAGRGYDIPNIRKYGSQPASRTHANQREENPGRASAVPLR